MTIASGGVLAIVAVWLVMFIVLGIRHVRLSRPAATRRRSSRLGLLLQAIAYALVFGLRVDSSGPFSPRWAMPIEGAVLVSLALCLAGAAIVVWSQQALGVQWSLTARLVEDHRLVIRGPYAYVRHPIYAAMILMLAGTGIALTAPPVVGVALAVYLPGTLVRVRAEEALMREAFGAQWEEYRRRVRALIPHVL